MHGGAVATVWFFDGTIVPCCVAPEELDDEELELDEMMQGGTISVVTLLFAGTTSWFCGPLPDELPAGPPEEPPPGVSRTVLDDGGVLPPLLELDELLLLELAGGWHGWTAIVWVSDPAGIVTWFEPGGIFVLPDCATSASEQGGTTTVSGECCFEIETVLTPGIWSAVDTASELELDDELPPQPATPSATTAAPTSTRLEPPACLIVLPL